MAIHDNEFFKVMGAHRQELASRFHVDSLSVFGSMVRGDAVFDSDLDILVKFRKTPGIFGFIDLKNYLEELTGHRVDLVTESALKKQLRKQIVKEAIRVA